MKRLIFIALLSLFACNPRANAQIAPADSTVTFSVTRPNAALAQSFLDDDGIDAALANAFDGITDTVNKKPVVLTYAQVVRVMEALTPSAQNISADLVSALRADLLPLIATRPWLAARLSTIDATAEMARNARRTRGAAKWKEILASQKRND